MIPYIRPESAPFLFLWGFVWLVGCGATATDIRNEREQVQHPWESGHEVLVPPEQKKPLSASEAVVEGRPQDRPPGKAEAEPLAPAPLFVHVVRWPRETFYSIALWYTGKGAQWRELQQANPTVDPRRIRVGDTILIPGELMATRKPMPKKFLSSMYPKKERLPPKPKPRQQAPEPKEVELFGPIEQPSPSEGGGPSGLPVQLETID